MNDNSTIIILCRNNYDVIGKTLENINIYCRKYLNVQEVLISDLDSKDGTNELLQMVVYERIKFFPFEKDEKTLLIKMVEASGTNNIILLDPCGNTRYHQIQRQIKKLRKTDLVLPNRFHDESRTKFSNDYRRLRERFKNIFISFLSGVNYEDMTNSNKAFHKDKILPLLKSCGSNRLYWIEIIKKCKKHGIRISTCITHYAEREKRSHSNIFKLIEELLIIRKI